MCRFREEKKNPKKTIRDILRDAENARETIEKPHKNVYVKGVLDDEGTSHAAHLHEIVSGRSSQKRPIIQKAIDKVTLKSMKSKADPVRHKRLYKALHNPRG